MIWRICITIFLSFAGTMVSAAQLVMFEEEGCVYCAHWKREIGPIYPKTPEAKVAPIVMHDISQPVPNDIELARGVVFTPTFVLVEDGEELGRIEGYPGEDMFWWMLARLLNENAEELGDTQ